MGETNKTGEDKIPNCWSNLPELFRDIDCGKFKATIRLLTAEDRMAIEGIVAPEYRKDSNSGDIFFKNAILIKIGFWQVFFALGGTLNGKSYKKDREGWNLKDKNGNIVPITPETLSDPTILHPVVFDFIYNNFVQMEDEANRYRDAILKNLNSQSR